MPDDIKKSKFQLEYMKATMFGGTWVKVIPFQLSNAKTSSFRLVISLMQLIFIIRLAFLPYLLFKFSVSDKVLFALCNGGEEFTSKKYLPI